MKKANQISFNQVYPQNLRLLLDSALVRASPREDYLTDEWKHIYLKSTSNILLSKLNGIDSFESLNTQESRTNLETTIHEIVH